jgi:predicted extracellular nuclease
MKLRVATFNIENLFTRFDFSAFSDSRGQSYLPPIVNFLGDISSGDLSKFTDFKAIVQAASVSQDDDKRQHTALAIRDADADILCLQEVDSIDALTRFRDFYLKKVDAPDYKQLVLHEGNDPRGIDVAAMVTEKISPYSDEKVFLYSKSHAWMRVSHLGSVAERNALKAAYPKVKKELEDSGQRIFRRDCLELELRDGAKSLTIFVCHFKSMSGGRESSVGTRQMEALGVKRIIEQKFSDPATAHWLILGDLNDYRRFITVSTVINADGSQNEIVKELAADGESGLDPLLDNSFAVNLVERRTTKDQWTHYYSGENHKTQLDYMLASPAFAAANEGTPDIIRVGQPYRVPNLKDPRYPRIGWDRPKASDHCPVVIEINF